MPAVTGAMHRDQALATDTSPLTHGRAQTLVNINTVSLPLQLWPQLDGRHDPANHMQLYVQ